MNDVSAAVDGEFVIRRTRLPRVTPFPSWNGVLATHASHGTVSVITESGRVLLLQPQDNDTIHVAQILECEQENIMSMCQAWSPSGRWLIIARDTIVYTYRRVQDGVLQCVSRFSLQFVVATIDVVESEEDQLHLAVGSVMGLSFYSANALEDTDCQLVSSYLNDVAVALVKFSPDQSTLSVGTVDGRVFLLPYRGGSIVDVSATASCTKVLASPRVTSISFSPSSDRVLVANRKGNVYMFTRIATSEWTIDSQFDSLTANPKGGAASQTLATWWSLSSKQSTPVFVIAGRVSSGGLELFDVHSGSLLHTLQFTSASVTGDDQTKRNDRHTMGVVCIARTHADLPRLLCIDSDATLLSIDWPFLQAIYENGEADSK